MFIWCSVIPLAGNAHASFVNASQVLDVAIWKIQKLGLSSRSTLLHIQNEAVGEPTLGLISAQLAPKSPKAKYQWLLLRTVRSFKIGTLRQILLCCCELGQPQESGSQPSRQSYSGITLIALNSMLHALPNHFSTSNLPIIALDSLSKSLATHLHAQAMVPWISSHSQAPRACMWCLIPTSLVSLIRKPTHFGPGTVLTLTRSPSDPTFFLFSADLVHAASPCIGSLSASCSFSIIFMFAGARWKRARQGMSESHQDQSVLPRRQHIASYSAELRFLANLDPLNCLVTPHHFPCHSLSIIPTPSAT